MSLTSGPPELPSVEEVWRTTLLHLKRWPYVVCISGTGSGKTLRFWMPLLFQPNSIQIIITPLNVLGDQNIKQLADLDICAIAICAKTATAQNFEDIGWCKYRVVVANLEQVFKTKGGFARLWRKKEFTAQLISVMWDEVHCIHSWASFQKDYGEVGRMRNLLSVLFLMPSATMPNLVLDGMMLGMLNLSCAQIKMLHRSNNHPNVYLIVQKMQHATASFRDLDFLLPPSWKPGDPVPRFLVLLDNIEESIQAVDVLQKRLAPGDQFKLLCFNSDVTPKLRETATAQFKASDIWGLYCTDSFGMGVDISGIKIVVHLWQRIGHAAQGPGEQEVAVVLIEPKYFDDEKAAAARQAEKAETQVSEDARPSVQLQTDKPILEDSAALPPSLGARASVAGMSEKLQVEYKAAKAGGALKTKKKKGVLLAPELDNLCFRLPIMAYYKNDRVVTDSHQCSTGADTDCARCLVAPSPICCSLCSSTHSAFVFLPPLGLASKLSAPCMSHVNNKYAMTARDIEFCKALHEFHRAKTLKRYGRAVLNNMGTGMVMGDKMLGRIADCAHAHYPPAPAPLISNPLRAPPASMARSETTVTVTARRCGVCGQLGHNRHNKQCPSYAMPASALEATSNDPTPDANTGGSAGTTASFAHTTTQSTSSTASPPTSVAPRSYNDFWMTALTSPSYRRVVFNPQDVAALTAGPSLWPTPSSPSSFPTSSPSFSCIPPTL
ncbi:P-loop containing nucleoside triphosphate hydrolase protein [Trametes gibbosa]|nr:P-loop containing nucleoside triphosphate hydrolase protein [Trametes gibbosa]